jgi:hypothetical protein
VAIWRNSVPGWSNKWSNLCKGPKADTCLNCLRNSREFNVGRTDWVKGEGRSCGLTGRKNRMQMEN